MLRRLQQARLAPGRPALALFLLIAPTAACVSTAHQSRNWSTYTGPGAEYFQAEEIVFPYTDDPLEPTNRVTSGVNYALMRWVAAPVMQLYRFWVPEPVRNHLAKAGENLLFPGRFVNNLLQGKLKESGIEASRFAVNTTVGVLGLYDPASGMGLHPYPEDFGQTFACWGWTPSTYIVWPILGPSTLRDGVGEIPDFFVDPATYVFPAAYAREFNAFSNTITSNLRAIESAYDAYEPARTLYMLQREVDVEDFTWHQDESGPTQTLRVIFLKPENERFADDALTRKVRIAGHQQELRYSLWRQPHPAPLMYVLPGFGGHRLSPSALALAEIGFGEGHTVVAVSSPTNWEFMRAGASVTVPGYGPVDAHDMHVALTAIDRDLEASFPGQFEERRLTGISIGAYQALLIAADRDRGADGEQQNGLIAFDQYVALNPPVDLEYGLRKLDDFYNGPLVYPPAERAQKVEEIFAKVLYLSHGDLAPGIELPFTELESRFLIGLAFRLDLQFMLLQSQDLFDSGVLQTPRSLLHMAPAFREAAEYSYMEYVYAFLLPYYAARDPDVTFDEAGVRTLFERSDLHTVAVALQKNDAVRVLTNENDFLLRPEDLTWLRATLGDRLRLFEDGGHLGNLYREYIRSVIGETLTEDAPPSAQ